MDILLVGINASYTHTNLAIRSLLAYCGSMGGRIGTAEYTVNHGAGYILSEIYRQKPRILCFSCYIWNILLIRELAAEYRKIAPDTVVIVGGPEASFDYAPLLAIGVDVVVIGEGEAAFAALAAYYLDGEGRLEDIKGIAFMREGKAHINKNAATPDLDSLPFVYEDVAMPGLKNRILYYESSRGCPYKCAYCLSPSCPPLRFLSMERVYSDLGFFLSHNVPLVKFVDRTFNSLKQRAVEIWRYLILNDNGVTRWHCEISGDLLDEEAFLLLETAREGLLQFEIGVQTVTPEVLSGIDREPSTHKLLKNIERLLKPDNIHIHLDLIAGLPGENMDGVRNSFGILFNLYPHRLQLGFLKLLKGSELWMRRREGALEGSAFTDAPPYEVLFTDQLTFGELTELKDTEEVFGVYYNSGRFRHTLRTMVKRADSPYSFFQGLSAYWRELGMEKQSKPNQYSVLHGYLSEICPDESGFALNMLKLDYLLSENAKSLPPLFKSDLESHSALIKSPDFIKRHLPHLEGLPAGRIKSLCNIAVFDYRVTESFGKPEHAPCALLFDYSGGKARVVDITGEIL